MIKEVDRTYSSKAQKYFFTIICILSPILRTYVFGEIELSAWCFLAIGIILLWQVFRTNLKIHITWQMLPMLAVLIVHAFYILLTGGNILGMFHQLVYLIVCFLFFPNFFDAEFGFKLYEIVTILSSVFGIIQLFVAEIFGYYISGALPISNALANAYAEEMNGGLLAAGLPVRPRSFFGEPSDFGIFVGSYLIILLFTKKKLSQKDSVVALLITLGQICVRSSTGILLLGVAWGGYIIKTLIRNRYSKRTLLLLALIFAGGVCFLFTDTFQLFAQRTFDLSMAGGTMGRIGGYKLVFDISNYSVFQLFFGHGLIKTTVFLPGWALVLWYFGIVGVMGYILMLRFFYKSAVTTEQRWISLIIAGSSVALATFFYMQESFYYALYFVYGRKGE